MYVWMDVCFVCMYVWMDGRVCLYLLVRCACLCRHHHHHQHTHQSALTSELCSVCLSMDVCLRLFVCLCMHASLGWSVLSVFECLQNLSAIRRACLVHAYVCWFVYLADPARFSACRPRNDLLSLGLCLCLCLNVSLCFCLCLCVSVCLRVYLSLSVPACVCVSVCLSFSFNIYLDSGSDPISSSSSLPGTLRDLLSILHANLVVVPIESIGCYEAGHSQTYIHANTFSCSLILHANHIDGILFCVRLSWSTNKQPST
jgi:hypothetical protein